uniref:Uncharacterized protein n=1 Tax=Knipowitschia caucasica TaxID=637954 RepID=A0AAV2KAX2_KNICA
MVGGGGEPCVRLRWVVVRAMLGGEGWGGVVRGHGLWWEGVGGSSAYAMGGGGGFGSSHACGGGGGVGFAAMANLGGVFTPLHIDVRHLLSCHGKHASLEKNGSSWVQERITQLQSWMHEA